MSVGPAYQAALRLLGRRDHFEAELWSRLRRDGFTDDEIEAAVARCRELGLVADEALARRFVELRSRDRGWGPGRLELELRRRGVDSDLAREVTRLGRELADDALAGALRRAESRARDRWWALPVGRARMVSSLIRYGFEAEEARTAVARLAADRERADHAFDDEPGDS